MQSRIKQLEKVDRIEIEEEDNSSLIIKFSEAPRSGRVMVEIKNLTKYYGEKLILSDIDFAIERGEKVAFVGKNGEGKTTLTRIIANETEYDGLCTIGHNVELGYFSQHQAELLDPNSTAFQVIDSAATGDMRSKVRSILGAFLFSGDSVEKKVKVLSGGEKSRLAIAKLLLQPHNLLILDEPTNHLDMSAKNVLKNALLNYTGSLILVSHDREFLEGLTTKTIHFKDKKVKEYIGGIDEFLAKQNIENLKEIEKNNQEKKNLDSSVQSSKISREEQKRIQREQNKIKKLINAVETEIGNIETETAELESIFASGDIYNNPEELKEKQSKYSELKNLLDDKMLEWERLSEDYENIV